MTLALPPSRYEPLTNLVNLYNKLANEDAVSRIFYLQKINFELQQLEIDPTLYEWMNDEGENGWLAQLNEFKINSIASFMLQGVQFVQAVAAKQIATTVYPMDNLDFYKLLQERDKLLKEAVSEETFPQTIQEYIRINAQLNQVIQTETRLKDKIEKKLKVLNVITPKILAIQGKKIDEFPDLPSYLTKELGEHVNNYNYKLVSNKWDAPLVLSVEDRASFGLEQELHSYEASKYFLEDYAAFMMEYESPEAGIVYRPVVVSQYANQSSLRDVAGKLKNTNPKFIGPKISYYFEQVLDLCRLLLDAGIYHPDIKLSNFLVHNNRVLIRDKKTVTKEKTPLASTVRSTPLYAPDEYVSCLNVRAMKYNWKAYGTKLSMPEFMSYQLGMALKEALILSQLDELPDDFRNTDRGAANHFSAPPREILNLSLLAQELTRSEPKNRLTVSQAAQLITFRSLSHEQFYKKVEAMLPSSVLGIERELKELSDLINSELSGNELLDKANPVLTKISERVPQETRLSRMAEKLSIMCFNQSSQEHYSKLTAEIESQIEHDRDLINSLLYLASQNGYSTPSMLQQASPLFTELFGRQPNDCELDKLTQNLASECFKRSKDYFSRLPAVIEMEIAQQDWNKAPWYRKALYWVTFGFWGVDKVTDCRSISIPDTDKGERFDDYWPQFMFLSEDQKSQFNGPEYNKLMQLIDAKVEKVEREHEEHNHSIGVSEELLGASLEQHIPQLNFLPPYVLKKEIGDSETGHLEDFIFNHLEKVNKAKPVRSESTETTDTSESSLPFESGGMIILDDQSQPSVPISGDSKAEELGQGSILIKATIKEPQATPKKEGANNVGGEHPFFSPKESKKKAVAQGTSEAPTKKEKPVHRKIESVTSSIFRGDGSHRNQKARQSKPKLTEINWEPPVLTGESRLKK